MAKFQEDEYGGLYELNMREEWLCSAYDEDGNAAVCDRCGAELKWDEEKRLWFCPGCGQEMERAVYFGHIGANPPSAECLTNCGENYPLCKKDCERVPIRPDDPMRL